VAELAEVQHWLQRAIFAGGAAEEHAGGVVTGSGALTPAERVGIYARGYRARLADCLRDDFPALRSFVGDTVFGLFAAGYVEAERSRRPSLYDFGAGFPGHLARTAPPEAAAAGSVFAIPAQLAALERARVESIRAVGIEREPFPITADLALVPGSRLRLPDSVRLLRLDFDFLPLLEAAGRGAPGAAPEARPTLTAVARSGWRVRVRTLDPWRFAFLEALPAVGGDVHAAAAAAARACERPVGAALAELTSWLPLAGAEGLVARA
jgi:hypothetical protein